MAQFKEIDDYNFPFEIGLLPKRELAFKFADYLNSIGIKAVAKPSFGSSYSIFVANESDVSRAKLELLRFGENPFNQAYNKAAWNRGRTLKRERRVKSNMLGFSMGSYTWTPFSVVSIIEIICLVFFVLSLIPGLDRSIEVMLGGLSLRDITENFEVWRLLTPAFLHFGFLHIAFNLVMFEAIARPLERHLGGWHIFYVTLSIAIVSNLLQYIFLPPNTIFGGLSGVVYGVIGYMGILSRRADVPQDMKLPPGLLLVCVVFIILGFLFFSGISNICHLGGLLMGAALGFINYKRPLR